MVLQTLPKAAEYAIKILTCLALSGGRCVSSGQVAQCVRIPASQAAKILHFLRWAGLVRSRRGSGGGYSLRKRPEDIRVEQVIQLFQPAPDEEDDSSSDLLLQIWSEASARSQQDWEQLTIAELARRAAGLWKCPPCRTDENSVHETQDTHGEVPAPETK